MLDKTQRVRLAQPRQDSNISLERCIGQRRSVRSFRDQALTKAELGQLLWAAQGVTGPDGGRTVPSAGALYPNRGRGYVYLEAGHAAESVMLQAIALGLAMTMVGAFSDDGAGRLLCLSSNEIPLCF